MMPERKLKQRHELSPRALRSALIRKQALNARRLEPFTNRRVAAQHTTQRHQSVALPPVIYRHIKPAFLRREMFCGHESCVPAFEDFFAFAPILFQLIRQ